MPLFLNASKFIGPVFPLFYLGLLALSTGTHLWSKNLLDNASRFVILSEHNHSTGVGNQTHNEMDFTERHLGALAILSLPIFILILLDLRVDLGLFIS